MVRFATILALAFVVGACASAPPASGPGTSGPSTREAPAAEGRDPARGTAADESVDTRPEEGDGAPLFRTAPERWWHLTSVERGVPGAGVDSAHALLAGRRPRREVVVAVIDGGIDLRHEDLDDVLWVNEDEVPGNGIDDDANGYVDDIHGWNFIGGPSGRNVDFDTYEVTRIHAACTGQPAGRGMERPSADLCAEAADAFDEEREKMTALQAQMTQIEQVYGVVMTLLSEAIGGEPTPARVARLQANDPRLAQARDIYLQLASSGIDADKLEKESEAIEGRLRYGLDPTYDPRPLVGDDFADPTERIYGNADVAGPDPSHGTAVASVLAAERDNGVGIEGVADVVRIMAVRAVPNGDERDKDVANAIRYAVDNGAHIVNMSFGKAFSPERPVVEAAIRHAMERGVLLVHAAGNDGADLAVAANFPTARYRDGGSADLWLEVGASSWQGADTLAAAFSNYGAQRVDLFAPGVAIRAASPGDDYGPADGTSIAAPVVTGVAGLLMAHFPELTAAEVRRILVETATDLRTRAVVRPGEAPGTVTFGELSITGGIVNAAAAVQRAADVAAAKGS